MSHVTCRLTARNRDQLRNPTLGNRVRASFTLFVVTIALKCTVFELGACGTQTDGQIAIAALLNATMSRMVRFPHNALDVNGRACRDNFIVVESTKTNNSIYRQTKSQRETWTVQ